MKISSVFSRGIRDDAAGGAFFVGGARGWTLSGWQLVFQGLALTMGAIIITMLIILPVRKLLGRYSRLVIGS